ncbi:MAG TPA: thioredoxin family protein [Phycisphaerae bacterium]|nr:thioredoxin family protein [Phycisphaerae bacterium]HNU43720.1 thioredoxin family protein [Phycisphaerae bacterium]
MRIEILGTGCRKCHQLEANAKAAADKLGTPYELVHVKDLNQIVAYGVLMTPALAIDGKVKLTGKVATEVELTALFQKELCR